VGSLRWRPPQPVIAWSGVSKASESGQRAMVFAQTADARALPNLERPRNLDAWFRCAWGEIAF